MTQSPKVISSGVAIMDPNNSTGAIPNTLKVNADGSINVEASGATFSAGAVATVAAPSYVEGTTDALSQNLTGALRVTSNTLGSGTATGAIRVELPSNGTGVVGLNAGAANIGNVGGKTVSVTVTPVVTVTNAYGTNYVVGGLLTFANAFTATGSGILQGVIVTIAKVETSGFTFFPFSANPSNTTWTDAAAANINAADIAKIRGPVSLTQNSQLGTTLYGVLLANAALTNQFSATTDVTVTVKILQDL